MSTSTGAPAAFARSLGKNDITNGVAAADHADAADDAGRADQEAALPLVHCAFRHDNPSPVVACGRLARWRRAEPAPNAQTRRL